MVRFDHGEAKGGARVFGVMLGYGFLGVLALVLFLTFAASGITWLIATVVPGTAETGRRSVGLVAGISGAILAAVLVVGAVLVFPGPGAQPRGPGLGGPGTPQQQQPRP